MSKKHRHSRVREDTKQKVRTTKRRLILVIGVLAAVLALLIFRAGAAWWPAWLVNSRVLIMGILGFLVLFLGLLSPIIIEVSRNPRTLSGPGKNPYQGGE